MIFPPFYTKSTEIEKLLYSLDVLKTSYEMHPVLPEYEVALRRKSLLKSSLFSAKIEGNTLEMLDIEDMGSDSRDKQKIEVSNLLKVYELLPTLVQKPFDLDVCKVIHGLVMNGLSGEAGHFRIEESAIFNQAGVAVYLTPSPQKIQMLLGELCKYAIEKTDPAPIVAAKVHIWFEKIHPFLDGNGRVGRLLSTLLLHTYGYAFGGIVPFEEYLESHRDRYYYALEQDRQDIREFIEFYLKALVEQSTASLKIAFSPPIIDPYVHLLPRRAEIMRIIKDHTIVTFDFLSRRFRAVPARTLHNDIAQLIKGGLIQKIGTTRGVSYRLKV